MRCHPFDEVWEYSCSTPLGIPVGSKHQLRQDHLSCSDSGRRGEHQANHSGWYAWKSPWTNRDTMVSPKIRENPALEVHLVHLMFLSLHTPPARPGETVVGSLAVESSAFLEDVKNIGRLHVHHVPAMRIPRLLEEETTAWGFEAKRILQVRYRPLSQKHDKIAQHGSTQPRNHLVLSFIENGHHCDLAWINKARLQLLSGCSCFSAGHLLQHATSIYSTRKIAKRRTTKQ